MLRIGSTKIWIQDRILQLTKRIAIAIRVEKLLNIKSIEVITWFFRNLFSL